jgi:peptide-methionine (S)-S-oxide reductase
MTMEKATFAAGCFWGVEFKLGKVPGVTETSVGYMGGQMEKPTYEDVCTDETGHAEVAQVAFNPKEVSFETLVRKFYEIHDPTTLNRQGPDEGSQYRSAIFYHSPEQKAVAERVTAELNQKKYGGRIVTQIVPAATYWRAEDYHQKYGYKNPGHHCTL